MLVAFLGALIGCQASTPTPRVAHAASFAAPTSKVKDPPGSLYVEESESPAPVASPSSACTPNGLFRANDDTVVLQKVCIRVFEGSTQALWYEALEINPKDGRFDLPFRDAYLVRRNRQAFAFHARQLDGQSVDRLLQPDAEGIYSFEEVRDNLEEVE